MNHDNTEVINSKTNLSFFTKTWIVMTGIGLCSSVPLVAIGSSFIIWPSTSEISGLILLVMSIIKSLSRDEERKSKLSRVYPRINFFICLTVIYICFITFIVTVTSNFSFLYPAWSIARFIQWAIIIPYVLLVCSHQQIKLLSLGIILGSLLNSFAAAAQRLGFLSLAELISHIGTAAGSGPWGTIYKYGGIVAGESVGFFTFSRTATGFFFGISVLLVVTYVKSNSLKVILTLLISIGVAFTGSRLGFFSLILILISLTTSRKNFFSAIILWLIMFFVVSWSYGNLIEDNTVGRLFGAGTGDYEEGFEGRAERQSVVFGLPLISIILGCGLGNLGSASGLADIGLSFYRAHGFFLTYLAEIGVFGSTLLAFTIYLLLRKFKFTLMTWSFILAIVLSGFSDDFMIPSAPSGHIPIIVAIIFRMTTR